MVTISGSAPYVTITLGPASVTNSHTMTNLSHSSHIGQLRQTSGLATGRQDGDVVEDLGEEISFADLPRELLLFLNQQEGEQMSPRGQRGSSHDETRIAHFQWTKAGPVAFARWESDRQPSLTSALSRSTHELKWTPPLHKSCATAKQRHQHSIVRKDERNSLRT